MNRIRDLRKEKGWGQKQLAAEIRMTPQAISRYELGERGLDVELIGKLCALFGCTSDYLLGRSDIRVYEFTDDEWQLVESYRSLSPSGREYIRHSLALAALAHSEKNRDLPDLEMKEG